MGKLRHRKKSEQGRRVSAHLVYLEFDAVQARVPSTPRVHLGHLPLEQSVRVHEGPVRGSEQAPHDLLPDSFLPLVLPQEVCTGQPIFYLVGQQKLALKALEGGQVQEMGA